MVKASIGGVTTENCAAINYQDDQEVTAVYAGGRYPVGYGKGRIEASGSITLLMEDVVALQGGAPGGRLQDIAPFNIVVSYLHPTTQKITTDVLESCVFRTNQRNWTEGDTSQKVELPLMIGRIKWGSTR
jgi:hypothetical protein